MRTAIPDSLPQLPVFEDAAGHFAGCSRSPGSILSGLDLDRIVAQIPCVAGAAFSFSFSVDDRMSLLNAHLAEIQIAGIAVQHQRSSLSQGSFLLH
jgi:hypothetical protein